MRHICAYKLGATYKMTTMYFLVNIHINNQSTLYKVNGVPRWYIVTIEALTPKIPWDQKLVDCCLGSLCEEK
jgi:hypothetical protein